jgi:hypothetical protein
VRGEHLVWVEPRGVELAADWDSLGSPETYALRLLAAELGPSVAPKSLAAKILRADEGTRTPDPLLTMEVLYQLSYVGVFRLLDR